MKQMSNISQIQAPATPQKAQTLNVKLKTQFVQEGLTNEYLDRVIWSLNKANKMSIWMLLMSNQALAKKSKKWLK